METLLERGDIAPDAADRDGRTPLSLVAEDVAPTLPIKMAEHLSRG